MYRALLYVRHVELFTWAVLLSERWLAISLASIFFEDSPTAECFAPCVFVRLHGGDDIAEVVARALLQFYGQEGWLLQEAIEAWLTDEFLVYLLVLLLVGFGLLNFLSLNI